MRLVHLSDLHLGFRQYQRLTPAGINQREADVAATFRRAIDRVIELAPDLVVVAGDVFHAVRPPNPAILHAFNELARLRTALPRAEVVIVAGNHDTPRTSEAGCILRLFEPLGIHVVEGEPRRIPLPALDASVLAVPDLLGERPSLTPDAGARFNVLVIHAEVAGVLPDYAREVDRAATEIARSDLAPERWDYVALGHYHVYREVAPNAYYSGSIDYTSANPWGEIREERAARVSRGTEGGKGIIERDLATGAHRFHQLRVARPLVDLPILDATGMTARDVDAAIAARLATAGSTLDAAVVRLVITEIPRHVARELDQRAIREIKRRALHFHLDLRRPEIVRRSASGAPGRRRSLAETLRDKLESRPIPPEVDRGEFVERGLAYLRRASALTLDPLGSGMEGDGSESGDGQPSGMAS